MRLGRMVLLAGFIAHAAMLEAQSSQTERPGAVTHNAGGSAEMTPAVEVSLGYAYLHANAPPGACECFSFNGGYGSIAANFSHGLGLVADISAATANNISGTSESLTVVNYLFGPRYSWRSSSGRFTPYGQFLFGGSAQSSNVGAVPKVNAFAFSLGGGVSARLRHRFGWNLAEAEWLHSQLPNAVNNRQNDLRISSGVIFRF